jgi:hypothetical protein
MKHVTKLFIAAAILCITSRASAKTIVQSPSDLPMNTIAESYVVSGDYFPLGFDENIAPGRAPLKWMRGEQWEIAKADAAKRWETARKAAIYRWAYQIQKTPIRDPKRLSASQLTAAGVIRWPRALQSPEFDATRTELDKLFAERAQGSTLAADELTRKIDSAATEMAKTLQESGADIPVMDRVNAKNFAAALRYEANVRPVSGEKQPAAATK